MTQALPHKPAYLSSVEWEFILRRDLHHCARFHKCRLAGQSEFCSATIDIDHEHPVELGGDDTVANVRLLCSSYNRGRPCEPAEKWREPNHWDQHDTFALSKLREIQRLVGWDMISEIENRITVPAFFRKTLLNTITLVPGATGIGKSLLAQCVLFRFNKLIGLNSPRVKSVLWLTTDTTLRDMAQKEIEEEAFSFGVVGRKPIVHIAKGFDDLLRGPNGADVVVSAEQSLWKKEVEDGPARSETEKIAALSHYDTIVFDECDWASDQVRHISQIARHAFQIALSASPRIVAVSKDNGRTDQFLKRFVLIASEAVADYTRALEFDGCLKLLEPAEAEEDKYKGHDFITRGYAKTSDRDMPRDHALYQPLILRAVVDADNIETRMKASHPNDYYSPHIMVRMETIQELISMHATLPLHLKDLYNQGLIVNDGWGVSMIFMGRQMQKLPPEERDLAAKRAGRWRHPFMLAKDNNGRATKASKRILLMCNIGARGINNWPISAIVDCTQHESPIDLIQFVWGRPIRLPPRLAAWTFASKEIQRYVTVKVWIPKTDGYEDKKKAIDKARKFIIDMLPMIRDAGFLTWTDLIEGKQSTDDKVEINVTDPPLTPGEKYAIQGALAKVVEATGSLTAPDVETTVMQLFPSANGRRRKKCKEYGISLIDPGFRNRETLATQLTQEVTDNPENVMDRLRPQETYDIEDLKRWVRYSPEHKEIWQKYTDRLSAGDEIAIHAVSRSLRHVQMSCYRPAARTYRLHGTKADPGVLLEIAGDLKSDLAQAKQLPENHGVVNHAINGAAKTLFAISDASEGGPMDHPAYHIAILGKHRRRLQAMARGRLIADGELGSALQRFSSQ